MLDIQKILTVSTIHISENTSNLLNIESDQNTLGICVYKKAEFGWFIVIDENTVSTAKDNKLPLDLANLILFAYDTSCKWLCIDCDGDEIPYLTKYER